MKKNNQFEIKKTNTNAIQTTNIKSSIVENNNFTFMPTNNLKTIDNLSHITKQKTNHIPIYNKDMILVPFISSDNVLRHNPAATSEWNNSNYSYIKSELQLSPVVEQSIHEIIKLFFNSTPKNIGKKKSSIFRHKSILKTYIATPRVKTSMNRARITVYKYERQKLYYINMLNNSQTLWPNITLSNNKVNEKGSNGKWLVIKHPKGLEKILPNKDTNVNPNVKVFASKITLPSNNLNQKMEYRNILSRLHLALGSKNNITTRLFSCSAIDRREKNILKGKYQKARNTYRKSRKQTLQHKNKVHYSSKPKIGMIEKKLTLWTLLSLYCIIAVSFIFNLIIWAEQREEENPDSIEMVFDPSKDTNVQDTPENRNNILEWVRNQIYGPRDGSINSSNQISQIITQKSPLDSYNDMSTNTRDVRGYDLSDIKELVEWIKHYTELLYDEKEWLAARETELQSLLNTEGNLAEGTSVKIVNLEKDITRIKNSMILREQNIIDYKRKLSTFTSEQLSDANVRKVSATANKPDNYFINLPVETRSPLLIETGSVSDSVSESSEETGSNISDRESDAGYVSDSD